jgi:hypothetical protein
MVVSSSPTMQSLMSRPSRAKKASALNNPVSPSPENIRGVSGSKATVPRRRAVLRRSFKHERVVCEVLGRHLIRACHHFERGDETPLGGPSVMLVQDQPRC